MSFTIIGVVDSAAAVEYLEGQQDLCFGKYFAKTASECINCRAPVVVEKKLVLMKELCASRCAGVNGVSKINRISAREVMDRLENGASIEAVFFEIVGQTLPEQTGAQARQLLVDRLAYLRTIGFNSPDVPKTKDLLK